MTDAVRAGEGANRVAAGPGWAGSALFFWLFIIAHAALWTLAPSLRNHNFPLDVIEHLAWGREWEFGYHKHPPMVSWILEAAIGLFGRSEWVVYGLSQACIAVAFFAVWRLARTMLGPWPALAATLAGEGVLYHGFTSPEFNVNVASLPFWAMALALSHRLFCAGPQDQRRPAWMLLGLIVGCALLTKYTAALLGLSVLVLMLLPPAWHWWRKPGPYLALGVFGLTVLPHLVWLVLHDFPSFTYALARSDGGAKGLAEHLLAPAGFIGGQLVAIAPILALTALAWPWHPRLPRVTDRQDLFLIVMGLGPFLILIIVALIFALELKAMWGTTLFLLLGLMLVRWLRPTILDDVILDGAISDTAISDTAISDTAISDTATSAVRFAARRRAIAGLATIMLLGPLIYIAEPSVANGLLQRGKRTQFPGPELAAVMAAQWEKRYPAPLSIVIGDEWLAGIVSIYAESRPSAFLDGDRTKAPWIRDGDLAQAGALVLWMADKRGTRPLRLAESRFAGLAATYPALEEQPPITLAWAADGRLPPVHVNWAIIPPQVEPVIPLQDTHPGQQPQNPLK